MSAWRREFSQRIPELRRTMASHGVKNPMALWIELNLEFHRLCRQNPIPLDWLRRLWDYAMWCMHQGGDVCTGAALGFCEHLLDSDASRSFLPYIMSRQDYEGSKALLLYLNTQDQYEQVLKSFVSAKSE
jgi:hypothetical protein